MQKLHCPNYSYIHWYWVSTNLTLFFKIAVLLLLLVPAPSTLNPSSSSHQKRKASGSQSESGGLFSNLRNADAHSILLLLVRFLFSFATLVFRENLTLVMQDKYESNVVNSGYLTSMQGLMSTLIGFMVGPVNAFIYRGNSLYMVLCTGIVKAVRLPKPNE